MFSNLMKTVYSNERHKMKKKNFTVNTVCEIISYTSSTIMDIVQYVHVVFMLNFQIEYNILLVSSSKCITIIYFLKFGALIFLYCLKKSVKSTINIHTVSTYSTNVLTTAYNNLPSHDL